MIIETIQQASLINLMRELKRLLTELNADDTKAKITFQMLDIAPIIITL